MSGTFCPRPSWMGASSSPKTPAPPLSTAETCFQLGAASDFLICHTGGIQDDLKQHTSQKNKLATVKSRLDAMLATTNRMKVLNPSLDEDLFKLQEKILGAMKTFSRGGRSVKRVPKAFLTRMKVANREALEICKKAKRYCGAPL